MLWSTWGQSKFLQSQTPKNESFPFKDCGGNAAVVGKKRKTLEKMKQRREREKGGREAIRQKWNEESGNLIPGTRSGWAVSFHVIGWNCGRTLINWRHILLWNYLPPFSFYYIRLFSYFLLASRERIPNFPRFIRDSRSFNGSLWWDAFYSCRQPPHPLSLPQTTFASFLSQCGFFKGKSQLSTLTAWRQIGRKGSLPSSVA